MASNSEDIAEALKTVLNAGTYSQSFTAVVPEHEPELKREDAGILVQVIPYEEEESKAGRSTSTLVHSANVMITAGMSSSLSRTQMNTLRDEIRTEIRKSANNKIDGCNWFRTEVIVSWSLEDKQERDQYSALLRIYYQEIVENG